jgi:hypothetical protein
LLSSWRCHILAVWRGARDRWASTDCIALV